METNTLVMPMTLAPLPVMETLVIPRDRWIRESWGYDGKHCALGFWMEAHGVVPNTLDAESVFGEGSVLRIIRLNDGHEFNREQLLIEEFAKHNIHLEFR